MATASFVSLPAVSRHAQEDSNWYFPGADRQQYAPSDIHVSQPTLGNDFTVRQAAASDFPSSVGIRYAR